MGYPLNSGQFDSEATLFNKSPDQEQTHKRYFVLKKKQLSLFAAEKRIISIGKFKEEVLNGQ